MGGGGGWPGFHQYLEFIFTIKLPKNAYFVRKHCTLKRNAGMGEGGLLKKIFELLLGEENE